MRIAVVASLYPNREQPRHGIFVEERLRALVASGAVEARVIAPVPWFFSRHPRFGRYARMAAVPRQETRHGLTIAHPRYVVLPRIGMTWTPASYARAVAPALASLRRDGFDFDLIDAHYLYPDGVAAARLARRFNRPLTLTARGADINQIARMPVPGRQIREAAAWAGGLIGVSAALSEAMACLGVDPRRLVTLRNGVDLSRFTAMPRAQARAALGWSMPTWLCVGHLIERKGMHIAIEALAGQPGVQLVLVGDGPEESALRTLAAQHGVADRVHFVGAVAHDDLPVYFSAADVLMHAAGSEGMPNVVLEAMACGCPVIATPVGGIPEVLSALPAGVLMTERSAVAMQDAWHALLAAEDDDAMRAARRRHAESFDWAPTTAGQIALFSRLTGITPPDGTPTTAAVS
ncbi:glycosyltransferase family 4 protein [Salinisphaera sp. Q1T1-3]|nr:glycosyltransferase family 4 protein [Salinisphaera sp. Q1T1-3]